jgi:hypothetical protein
MNPDHKQQRAVTLDITKEELEAAKKVIATLLLAKKNFSLYPEGHISTINSVDQSFKQLEIYLQKFGNLRFEIEKDRLLSQGEVIYSGPTEEGSLSFIFFRDGIRWLEITDGIDSRELMELLKIIVRYSTLSEEPDGDIVTCFWETQLPHIRYEVADFFWGSEQDSDLMPAPDMDDQRPHLPVDDKSIDWSPLPEPAIDLAALFIDIQEKETIREMVEIEEKGDPAGYLDALLDSLLQDREQGNFEIILEVLEEEFKNSLPRKDFDIALKILLGLQEIRSKVSQETPWAVPLLEDFALTLSSSQYLGPLKEVWADIGPVQLDKVKQMLHLLQPEAISTLGAILVQNQSPRQRQILVEVITSLSSQNFTPLEFLLMGSDQKITEKLVHVLVNIEGERPSNILSNLVHHVSPSVRQEAVKELLRRGTASKKEIFALITNKDESVRSMVLKQMGQTRDEEVESFLSNYLQHRNFKSTENEHVLDCFTALGKSGSSHSVPFLRQALFGKGLLPVFGKSAYREGAALALSKMGIKESRKVLEDAGRSLNPSVRSLGRKYMKELV